MTSTTPLEPTDPAPVVDSPRSVRRRQLAAYLFIAFCGVLAVLRLQNVTDKANNAAIKSTISSQHAEQAANDAKEAVAAVKQEVLDRAKASCESANTSRREIRQSFNDLLNLAISAQPENPNETEQQRALRKSQTEFFLLQFNSKLETGLPIIDCDALASTSSTTTTTRPGG